MQNLGFERLLIVAPECEIGHNAREGAASAQEVLAKRVVYETLNDFYKSEGDGLRVAFTRRDGFNRPTQSFTDFINTTVKPKITQEWSDTPIYLFFGSEDDGLTNAELEYANFCCNLPVYGKNGSYNLAQAVLLTLYILRSELSPEAAQSNYNDGEDSVQRRAHLEAENKAVRSPMEYPKDTIDKWLTTLGFELDLNRRRSISGVINNLLLRAVPDKKELQLFSSVLHQTIRKLNLNKTQQPSEMQTLGFLESDYKTKFGTPRQPLIVSGGTARLKINREWQPEFSLEGLEKFSHIWLIFLFHENSNKMTRPKVHPPRLNGKSVGVFASRSPHRPNPIGLSLVKLEKIEGDTLYLSGIDLIDGTPILDIKPYIKSVESQPNASEGWLADVESQPLEVRFKDDFATSVKSQCPQITEKEVQELQSLIREVLQNDPRPLAYKFENEIQDEKQNVRTQHAIYLQEWDIHFEFQNSTIEVTSLNYLR